MDRGYVWKAAIDVAKIEGLNLEFGVATGISINALSNLTNSKWYGFDSFKGLPEAWHDQHVGGFACAVPSCGPNVELVIGLFQDTLDKFLEDHEGVISILHIDCDIYSSTKFIFDRLKDRIIPGTVVIFDELKGYNGWEEHEHKAFMEFLDETQLSYEDVAESGGTVYAVKIINKS
jgi:hypothetical protein